MMELTKGRIEQFIKSPLDNGLTRGEQMAMARQLLAGLEQESVAWTDAEELRDAKEGACGYLFALDGKANKFADPRRMIMLYAAPQLPHPAVPDMAAVGEMPFLGTQENAFVSGWNACRAAMLQGAHRDLSYPVDPQVAEYEKIMQPAVPDEAEMPGGPGVPDYNVGWANGWNSCREEMLQGAESSELRCSSNQGAEPVRQTNKLRDGHCIMPLKLTAENGAKGALSGEFHVTNRIVCQSCSGEGCEDCNDEGGWDAEIPVSWDTIKRIHEAAVEACSLPAAPQQEVE